MREKERRLDIPRGESLYLRILQEIEHETKYGKEDCTEELACLIDQYTEEYGPHDGSGIPELETKLEEYKAAVKKRKSKQQKGGTQ